LSTFNLGLTAFGNRLLRLPIVPAARRFRRAKKELDETVYRLIAERRATGHAGRDVVSMLVAARDVEGDNTGMSDEQIRDEVLTLLLAGHETTANALTWTWYLLSQNPDAEQRLHSEVDQVLAGRAPGAANLEHLKFTRAVLSEAMRLYPPAYVIGRRTLEDYHVPGTDYVLPAGTVVLLSQFLLHRDPRFWDEPDRFAPERWLKKDTPGPRHRFAYFPFGAGQRVCIGEHFAWMGWKARSCWRPLRNDGGCVSCPGTRSSRTRSSRCARSTGCG
jgi:cytochrome P450